MLGEPPGARTRRLSNWRTIGFPPRLAPIYGITSASLKRLGVTGGPGTHSGTGVTVGTYEAYVTPSVAVCSTARRSGHVSDSATQSRSRTTTVQEAKDICQALLIEQTVTLLDAPPANLAERFAKAVAARCDELLVVHPDNTAHWEPWPDDGVPPTPYAVHVAHARGFRTLALDFDGPSAERDAARAVSLLRDASVQYVLTLSGPQHRWHVIATFDAPISPAAMARMARALRRVLPALDDAKLRNPETGAIRPPLSPHRLSGRSEPLGNLAEALSILETGNPPQAWRRLADSMGVPLLTTRMERLLRYGDEAGNYRSRSEVVHAIAIAHANMGSTLNQLLEDLIDSLNVAGEKVRDKRVPEQYVRRSWLRARERVQRLPLIRNRAQALAHLARIRGTIEGFLWHGRSGATAYAVMLAHLAIAERAGGPEYNASVRELAERAGVHVRTVIRHHKRLIVAGWLRRRGLRYRGEATRWRLCRVCHHIHPPRGV